MYPRCSRQTSMRKTSETVRPSRRATSLLVSSVAVDAKSSRISSPFSRAGVVYRAFAFDLFFVSDGIVHLTKAIARPGSHTIYATLYPMQYGMYQQAYHPLTNSSPKNQLQFVTHSM